MSEEISHDLKDYNQSLFVDFFKESKNKNITQVVREFCTSHGLEYSDSIRRAFSSILQRKGLTKNTKPIEETLDFKNAKQRYIEKNKKYYIITAAQNGTPIHEQFFNNMLSYKNWLGDADTELIVIASRYKNPTSVFTDRHHDSWSDIVLPYLSAQRYNIHKYLQVLADIKIQPTASTPLSGLNGISGRESCILGHPRVHMKCLPILNGYPEKILATTGFCSIENYTDSKSGKKGEFHHQLGFVIVEIVDSETFIFRQVIADKHGNFYDLHSKVIDGIVMENDEESPTLVLGDIHFGEHNVKALNLGVQLIYNFKAQSTILHDLFSGYSINHHEDRSPFVLAEKEAEGKLNLKQELEDVLSFIRFLSNVTYPVIVRSNHDEFLDKFLDDKDWRKVNNKQWYLEIAAKKAHGLMSKGVLPYLIEQEFTSDEALALGINDSFSILGTEFGVHGHIGANGSRGSAIQFKDMNTKNVTAHTHSPTRLDGHSAVGTNSEKRLGYNNGLSSWAFCDIIMHSNGKTQHIFKVTDANGFMLYTTLNKKWLNN